jgi:23S rRNA (uridine2552-2'-O)-methyltransferase
MKKAPPKKNKTGLASFGNKRRETVWVKAKKSRSESSRQWLQRQLNDPYVMAAKEQNFRSRAAFKIIQIDEKFNLLRSGMRVVDLGAAPGGWTQVVAKKIGKQSKLIALDILPMAPLPGAKIIQMDFLADEAPQKLKSMLGGQADLVLSDMAPPTTGHSGTDHIRIMMLAENAVQFAIEVLAPGGVFVCKFFQGGAERDLLTKLKQNFTKVRHSKPPASRAESSETYLVAQGFHGGRAKDPVTG